VKKRGEKDGYLLNHGGFPRLGQVVLNMENPDASALSDPAYLEFVLAQVAAAMFPLAGEPPKIDIHTCDSEDNSVLHYACTWGDIRAVRLLVGAGASVNKLGDMDQTPLHCAVSSRFLDIIEFLLNHGATQDQKDAFGYTPLEWAKQMEYSDVISILQRR
jgi:uncharacterized protein